MNSAATPVRSHWRYRVEHETEYRYQSPVTLSQQYLHLTPRSFALQATESHRVVVRPGEHEASEGRDYFGNPTRRLTLMAPHKILNVHAESVVSLSRRPNMAALQGSKPWEAVRDVVQRAQSPDTLEATRYLYASPHVELSAALELYARPSFRPGRPILEAALDLTQRIFADFKFDPAATEISTPLEQVLSGRRGVCQDFAQLMIGCLRSLGLPARYLSGYILTHPKPGQPRLIGADASHAWISVFCPVHGWIDFDPTNRCLVQGEHITLGWGRDFSDVTPMRGIVLGGGAQQLQVKVTVTPLG